MMQIPGYTIIRELGRGGMATVYLAKQNRLGRQVALKVMQPLATTDDDFTARFIKEGRIIAQLQHPKIVTIYDFDIADGLHYFSMEYLPNGTLSDQIQQGLSTERAIEITRGIAEALAVAHDQGVIHRDIKPQNVLFRADGTPVLTDFGIARAAGAGAELTQVTTFGMVIGSPRYMSPEQSLSKPIDARSDLYGLGVAFYEMLTKQLPYQADDVISLAMKHCSAPIPYLSGPLAKFQPIIEKLLAKQPEDRFGSAQELIRALDAFQSGQSTTLTRPLEEATRIVDKDNTARSEVGVQQAATSIRPKSHVGRSAIIAILIAAPIALGFYLFGSPPVDDPLETMLRELPAPTPGRPATTDRYERLALEHFRAGELPRGLELVELALSNDPADPRLRSLKARLIDQVAAQESRKNAERELENGAIDDSLRHIEDGLARVPGHPELIALRERAFAERALRAKEQASELRQKAEVALDQNDLSESMRLLHDARSITPDDEQLQALETEIKRRLELQASLQDIIRQASSLVAEGLLQDALDLIKQGLSSNPDDEQLQDLQATVRQQIESETARAVADLVEKARSLASQDRFDDALEAIEQGLQLQPEEATLQQLRQEITDRRSVALSDKLFDQARKALAARKLNEALRLADEGLAIYPENVGLFTFRSIIQAEIAQEQSARAAIAQVRALLNEHAFEKSLEVLEDALELSPDNPKLLTLRGEILSAQKQLQQDQVKELLRHAAQLLSADNLEGSLELTKKALTIEPKNSAAAELEKQILQRQEAKAEIAGRVEACARLQPNDPLLQGLEDIAALASAADCYRQVLIRDERNPQALRSLSDIKNALTLGFGNALDNGDLTTGKQFIEALQTAYPEYPELGQLQARLETLEHLMPEMVALKSGCFQIGSPQSEAHREQDEPQRRVCVDAFALATQETKAAEFRRFVDSQDYQTDAERGVGGEAGCWTLDLDNQNAWAYQDWANWHRPNKYQDAQPDLPVTCVSKNDAVAYIQWLNAQTGQRYRLPTEAEWEYAARAGTTSSRFWGPSDGQAACKHANIADTGHDWDNGFNCDDGYEWAAPVGRYSANPWGLHDVLGNVSEWTCSEYNADYSGAETTCANDDSTAPISLRGGAWNSRPEAVRSAYRNRNYPESRYSFVGFRLVREIADLAPAAKSNEP